MSQEALAELAGVGQSTVDRAESGKASVESARKLASVTAGAVRWVDIFEEVADSDDTDPTPHASGPAKMRHRHGADCQMTSHKEIRDEGSVHR